MSFFSSSLGVVMLAQKIQPHDGKRSWFARLLYPAIVEQKFIFEKRATYDSEIQEFLDAHLLPRSEWLREQAIKCRMTYTIQHDTVNYRVIKVMVEFRNAKIPALYKLRWS